MADMQRGNSRRGLREMLGIDPRSLALLRMGVGSILLADLLLRARDLSAHYTDWGVLPRQEAARWLEGASRVSVYQLSGESWFVALLFTLAAVFALLLVAGYRTRVATVVSWYLLLSLHTRNPAVLHGGDNLLRLLLFWAMFLPWGAAWSVDGLRHREPRPVAVRSHWVTAVRLHVCLVYWTTAAFKWHPPWLEERSAIGLAMTLDQITTSWGELLKGQPQLLATLTPLVLAFEILAPLVVWSPVATGPLRFAVVLLFAGFHLAGLGPALKLGIFPWVASVAWLLFLPLWFWEHLESRGRVERGRRGVARLVPGLTALPDRPASAPAAGVASGRRRLLEGALAGALLAGIVAMNVGNLAADRRGAPPPKPPRAASYLGLQQSWRMFAPAPGKDDGWYVVPARLADGQLVDLWTGERLDFSRPRSVSSRLGNARWIKYLGQLNHWNLRGHLPLFARYLCRRWNERHPEAERALELEVVFLFEETLAPNRERPPRPVPLWRGACPAG